MKRHIAVVRQDNNGDVLLTGPAVRRLAAHGTITLVCGPSGEAAARLLPDVERVVVVRADWICATPRPIVPREIQTAVATLARLELSEAFVFTSFHQSPLPTALLLRLAGVSRIHAVSTDYPGSLLDTRCAVEDDIHEVERNLAVVTAAGYPANAHEDPRLALHELPDTGRFVAHGTRYIAIQPGATVPARRWEPEKMRAVVARLAQSTTVVVLGSTEEIPLGKFVTGDSPAIDLTGKTTFAEFAGLIARAQALIVGNSSGIHVASATGTPVVTVFPPTIAPVRFAPWHVPHIMLGDHAIGCSGCRAKTCPIPGQPCIGTVSIEDVLSALSSLMGARVPA
jgi:ADP-heptose:LPS heptosyltransferase